ncbi:HXXEE domain-containing protein [Sporosarcina sp. Te-1]|uniref:HXXEE domain-containing protein n=1 Tax=Sporosarcina sp. Te-1 TaxID=2818390 RepID=UPI001A9EB586|nr:HXXEE domain-containing protein [Sporosarcina sp. Te-1]QTD41886.1 HXXEE domain-containing protein [Sporosarcina sp. Te-1]
MFPLELANAIWLFVIIFMIHDFEEIIVVEHWSGRVEERVKRLNRKLGYLIWRFWKVNSYQFAKRDIFIFLVASCITILKVQFMESDWAAVMYVIFLFIVLLHNAIHLVQTIILRSYTPGLYTSVLIVTPYCIYLLFALR